MQAEQQTFVEKGENLKKNRKSWLYDKCSNNWAAYSDPNDQERIPDCSRLSAQDQILVWSTCSSRRTCDRQRSCLVHTWWIRQRQPLIRFSWPQRGLRWWRIATKESGRRHHIQGPRELQIRWNVSHQSKPWGRAQGFRTLGWPSRRRRHRGYHKRIWKVIPLAPKMLLLS